MEIAGPDRLNISSSINVAAKGLAKAESAPLPDAVAAKKLVGCKAISLQTLLARTRPNLGNGVSGVFSAADGIMTDPITLPELVQGFIVHSDSSGAELPSSLGGPLRVVFPEGVAVQSSVCGTHMSPVNVKNVIKLELHSEYELKEQSVAKEMSNASPKIIAELEEYHKATLMALASVHGGCGMPLTVAIAGLDARGLMLRVSESDGGDEREILAPFPRPLVDAADVLGLVMEMHRAAFATLDWKFKLRSGYYTEPAVVACRVALARSPSTAAAATALAASAAVVGVLLLRSRRR